MKNVTKQIILLTGFFLSIAFVWGQSCKSKNNSEIASDVFINIIKPLEEIKPNDTHTAEYEYYNHLIRKSAHVVEFVIIGCELALIILFFSKKVLATMVIFLNSLMAGMLIGLIDESIQIFSERGTQVSDVWYDIIGTGIGAGVVSLLYAFKKRQEVAKNTENG